MQEWTDGVKIAVDVIVACVIVVALIVVNQLSHTIMRTMDAERAAANTVHEYRLERMYDNEDCYPQDVVSLILEYQGSPAVNVVPKAGAEMSWNATSMYTTLSSSAISAVLNQTSLYHCTLVFDASGSLASYDFQEV